MIKKTAFLKSLTYLTLLLILSACASKKSISVGGAIPRDEPPSPYGNPTTYEALGESYSVLKTSRGYKEKGIASWYGPDFHAKRTSSGTPYDMHSYSAAHKSLPIPTYVRVTNLENQKSLILRVDDRGPFKPGRIIDLSYAAANDLGVIAKGTAPVEVEAIEPFQSLDRPRMAPDPVVVAAATRRTTKPQDTNLMSTQTVKTNLNSLEKSAPVAHNETLAAIPTDKLNAPITPQLTPSDIEIQPDSFASAQNYHEKVNQSNQITFAQPSGNNFASTNKTSSKLNDAYFLQLGAFSSMNNAKTLISKASKNSKIVVNIEHDKDMYKVIAGPYLSSQQAEQMRNTFNSLGIESARIIIR